MQKTGCKACSSVKCTKTTLVGVEGGLTVELEKLDELDGEGVSDRSVFAVSREYRSKPPYLKVQLWLLVVPIIYSLLK